MFPLPHSWHKSGFKIIIITKKKEKTSRDWCALKIPGEQQFQKWQIQTCNGQSHRDHTFPPLWSLMLTLIEAAGLYQHAFMHYVLWLTRYLHEYEGVPVFLIKCFVECITVCLSINLCVILNHFLFSPICLLKHKLLLIKPFSTHHCFAPIYLLFFSIFLSHFLPALKSLPLHNLLQTTYILRLWGNGPKRTLQEIYDEQLPSMTQNQQDVSYCKPFAFDCRGIAFVFYSPFPCSTAAFWGVASCRACPISRLGNVSNLSRQ